VKAVLLFLALLSSDLVKAAEPWREALARMPLHSVSRELNRTNCVDIVLDAFQSNEVVKAVIFMPGATDELYLFRRAKAALTNQAPTLLDAINALASQTFIQPRFQAPFILLHTDEDPLEPANTILDSNTAERLQNRSMINHLSCNDWDWDALQPVLKHSLKIGLRPWRYSVDSWHFYRHSFSAWNLDGLEALQLAALAGKSKFVLRHREAIFEVDPRVPAVTRK
jgi:hypothetical protein